MNARRHRDGRANRIRPWRHRSWIFPRDPEFAAKAGRILDLYEGIWEGEPLGAGDYLISADEKTSIQARKRLHPTQPPDCIASKSVTNRLPSRSSAGALA